MPHVTHVMENVCNSTTNFEAPVEHWNFAPTTNASKMSLDALPSFLIDSNVSEAKTTKE
jgi:hypothetical protein